MGNRVVSPCGVTVSTTAVPVALPVIATVGGDEGSYPLPLSVIIIFVRVSTVRIAFAVAVFPPVPVGAAMVTDGAPLS